MNPDGVKENARGPLFFAVGFAGFLAGVTAWAWLGEWRWAVTGCAVLFLGGAVDGVRYTGTSSTTTKENHDG